MSDELKQEWNKIFYNLMKYVTRKNAKDYPYTKDEYHAVAQLFNEWLITIAKYKDEKGKYSNYFEWLNNQAKGNILANNLIRIFIMDNTEENYNAIVDNIEWVFDRTMEENILTLSIKYNEEYNKFLNDFRQTDAYKQWTLKCNKNKQFKTNWLRKKGSFFCLYSIIVFSFIYNIILPNF